MPFEPLRNAQHEAFAEEFSLGRNATEAYMKVYGTENRATAASGGYRLLRRKTILARIQAFQQAGAAGVALDLRRMHDFLTRAVMTPAGQVLPSSDLCSRVKHTRDGATDVWMPDKLACIRLSAKLQGFLDRPASARTAAKSSPIDDLGVMTEERRAVMCQQKREATLARLQREEEERLASEQQPAPEKSPVKDRPVLDTEKRRENPPAPPMPQAPRPAPPEPKPDVWIGPSGRYPYFGMNFRKPPQPPPAVPIIPPPDAAPNPNQSAAHSREHQSEPVAPAPAERDSASAGQQPASSATHQPPPAVRVTPEDSPKNLINSHHPTKPEPPETNPQEPITQSEDKHAANLPRPAAPTAHGSNQGLETRNLKPETPRVSGQPDYRVRLSHEAAVRRRLTGDDSTTHNTLVII